MSRNVKAVPEGAHTVTPALVVRGAEKAIAFYKQAFGATESCRMICPSTQKVAHAELMIGNSRVYLGDEFTDMGVNSPQTVGGSPVTIHLSVEDADAVASQAVEAGATLVMPVAEMFWGDRYGKLTDPFGHNWSVSTHVEDLTAEQIEERMASAFAPAS